MGAVSVYLYILTIPTCLDHESCIWSMC